jgi:large subunit ribosomal protein L17
MRHRNHSQRLSQKPHIAGQIVRNMATSIILYEHVRTTKKRAQVVRPVVDQLLTIGKSERIDIAIRRMNQIVTDKNASRKIMEVLKHRYSDRTSGFTRAIPVGQRKGDGALLVDIMLMEGKAVEAKDSKDAKEAKEKKMTKKKSSKSS